MKQYRILSAVLALVLLASLAASFSGCRKKQTVEKQIVDHVYRATTVEVEGIDPNSETSNFNIQQMYQTGDGVILTAYYWNRETYESSQRMYRLDPETAKAVRIDREPEADEKQVKPAEQTEEENIQQRIPAADGSLWECIYRGHYDAETDFWSENYYLRHTAADGTQLCNIDLADVWGENTENEWHYLNNAYPLGDALLISDNFSLFRVESDGSVSASGSIRELSEQGYVQTILVNDDAVRLMHVDYSGPNGSLRTLIPLIFSGDKITLGEKLTLDNNVFGNVYTILPGPGYTFYYTTEDGVYGYKLETNESELLLDYLNSDLSSNVANNCLVLSPDRFVVSGYDEALNRQVLMILNRVPEDQIVPKYILTLAAIDGVWAARSAVLRFNRQSDEYRIRIKNYSTDAYYEAASAAGGEVNYIEIIQKVVEDLNNDIIAGRVPDLLFVNEYMPMDSYAAKGLLVDMNKRLEADGRFSRNDYLLNVLSAFEIGGKLYQIMPYFSVETFAGKRSVVGDRTRWTMAEFIQWADSLPEKTKVFEADMTRDNLLNLFIAFCYDQFVDPLTGQCSFDSEEFKQLLRYANTLATKTVWEEHDNGEYDEEFWQEYWENYDNRFREDTVALSELYLSNFNSYVSAMSYTFYSRDIALVGLPTASGSGAAITSNGLSFAMTTKSQLQDGAWEFISYFLTEEYQDSVTNGFPLRVSSLEKMAKTAVEQAQEQKKQFEENGGYYDGPVVTGTVMYAPAETAAPAVVTAAPAETEDAESDGKEVVIEEPVAPMPNYPGDERFFLDQEMADEVMAFLRTLDHTAHVNASIMNIIHEDAGAYFAGQKSLDEVVKIIQDRATKVIFESR